MSTDVKVSSMRSDRKVHPTPVHFRTLTNDECKALTGHACILDRAGKIADVKITSIKTWKRKPDFEIRCKYGLYEFFTIHLGPNSANTEFVQIIPE